MALFTREEALNYHRYPRPGKLEVVPIKSFRDQKDLSMAYSPGVAQACLEIARDPKTAAIYTGRNNLVAVVSNGSAVLGLGNIGALAGKPVMEGKGVLFKSFADIDVYDIDLGTKDPDEIIKVVKCLEPTFGGINLEDIKAPECFYIEEELKKQMNIPVFHDDQHGTAIISGAALLNSCEITGKKIDELKIVVVGAGAAGIACASFYVELGVKRENIFMFDSRGLIYKGRDHLNKWKEKFAQPTNCGDLAACMKGADMFLGLSKKGLVSKDMVRSMAHQPVIFAMANPDPEITYEDAKEARPEAIMGTGRSDYPNQINNVSLHFPRSPRRARHRHQRSHEARRRPRARRSRQGTRASGSPRCLQYGQGSGIRPGLRPPEAARFPHSDHRHPGRGKGRHGKRCRPDAHHRFQGVHGRPQKAHGSLPCPCGPVREAAC